MRRCFTILIVSVSVLSLAGCAAGPNQLIETPDDSGSTAGFWYGLWHGFIVVFTFIVSLFNDNVGVYDVHNKGHLYDLGFVLGMMMFFGGSGGGACRQSRRK